MNKKIIAILALLATFLTGCGQIMSREEFHQKYGDKWQDDTESNNSISNNETVSNNSETSVDESLTDLYPESDGYLTIEFVDVGQGDCTIVSCGGETMVVDAGQYYYSDNVDEALKGFGITPDGDKHVNLLVVTHRDADHCGGADNIIDNYMVDAFMTPTLESDSECFNYVLRSLEKAGLQNTYPEAGASFYLGGATVQILGPVQTYNDDNNNSIVLKVIYGNTSFLLPGDAENIAEQDLVASGQDLSATVYHVGHHGSNTCGTEEFLNAVNPVYAVISCGEDNEYGHPTENTLNKLKNRGITLFRTDKQGSIVAVSDGNTITWSCEPCNNWKPGEYKEN